MIKVTKKTLSLTFGILFLLSSIFIFPTEKINAASTSWNFKDTNFINLGTITSTKTVDNLTLLATSQSPVELKRNSQTLDGTSYPYCLSLGGSGSTEYRAIRVPVSGSGTLKVTLMSSGSSSRNLAIADSTGKSLTSLKADTSISVKTYQFSNVGSGLYLYSTKSNINIFKIQVDDSSSSSSSTSSPTDATSPTSTSVSSTQASGLTKTITSTITVKAGETYDGKGIKIIAQGMGDGGQGESQKPIFKLEKGANLANVIIGAPGCDGVHCYGNNTITNVHWEDVGEDALTVKGSSTSDNGTITIQGGSAKYAYDKLFQINGPCTFKVSNFNAYDIGKFVRQNGDTTFKANIFLDSCTIDKVKDSIARTDSSSTQIYYKNLKVSNCKTWWKVPNSSQVSTY